MDGRKLLIDVLLYSYAHQNPILLRDPNGEDGLACAEGVACQTLSNEAFNATIPKEIREFEDRLIKQKFGADATLSKLEQDPNYHAYSNLGGLCVGCDPEKAKFEYGREPAPSLTGPAKNPVRTGDTTNDVFAAPMSSTGAPIRVPLVGGRVSHVVDEKTGAIANITADYLHTLNPGYIIRWIEKGPDGVLMSRTLGRGTGGFARANEILGARLFGETDARIRERLK